MMSSASLSGGSRLAAELHLTVASITGHEYDVSGVFATNPKDAPGPGDCLLCWQLL